MTTIEQQLTSENNALRALLKSAVGMLHVDLCRVLIVQIESALAPRTVFAPCGNPFTLPVTHTVEKETVKDYSHNTPKLSPIAVRQIRSARARGTPFRDIEAMFGISRPTAARAAKGTGTYKDFV